MVRAYEPKNITSSFLELPEIEPSRAELLKTRGSRAKFRAEPRLDTPLLIIDIWKIDMYLVIWILFNSILCNALFLVLHNIKKRILGLETSDIERRRLSLREIVFRIEDNLY